ncbi:hypothetical protein Hanom_Chr07g00652121 [Helianthus anomalus]
MKELQFEEITEVSQLVFNKSHTSYRIVSAVVIVTVWRIWSARNTKVFDDLFIPITKTVELIKEDSFLWVCNRAKNKNPVWDKWVLFDVIDLL